MSRSQSRTNARLELAREERRYDAEAWAWSAEVYRQWALWEAYEAGLVTDDEFDLEDDIHCERLSTKGYAAIRARSDARKSKFLCSVCGDPVYALGLCQSCYNFRRKYKRDRTDDEVLARNGRMIAKAEIQEERRAARRVLLERDH